MRTGNNILYFGLGTIFGAATAAVSTYYIVNAKRDQEMDKYADHCEARIKKLKEKNSEKTEEKQEESDPEPVDDEISKNEGVKKYHHSDGLSSKYGEHEIFGKPAMVSVYEERKEKKKPKLINEIDEDEFMCKEDTTVEADETYDKQTIDILLGDDQDIVGFWGYGTDNEEFVDDKFDKSLGELVGFNKDDYDYLLKETDNDEGIGVLYLRNDELMTDFEVIIHDMREEDKK